MSGNSSVKWCCTRTDCLDSSNQPLTLLSFQMAAILTKLDDLLGKVNKIDTISKDVADIKNEVSTIRTGLAPVSPESRIEFPPLKP